MKLGRLLTLAAIISIGLCVVHIPAAGAADTVKLGIMYSLTGPGSVLGVLQKEGAELAIKEVNDAGGVTIGGKKVLLEGVFRDDETNPQVAIRRLKEMAQVQGVQALVGGTFGHVSMALNIESKKSKVFLMTTNGVPEKFFNKNEKSPTALNIMATSESAGRGAAAYIAGPMKAKKVACFMPDYVIGKTTFKGYEAVMNKNSKVPYEAFWVPVKTADMTPYLIKVKEYGPDVLFMGSWGGDAINALKAANEMGLSKNMKIFHFWLANVFAVGIPAEAMEGIWSQMFWYWNMAGFKDNEVVSASKAFSDKYIAAYGNPPDPYAMAAYAGVMETARAMSLSGSTDPKKMYAALMDNPNWKGPKGSATWRQDGRPMYKYATYIVEGKGPDQRSSRHPKYDYAKIVDAYAGKAFLPPLSELGY
jgi:branched-chain amino acid transport system substrate-binding protein